MITHTEIHILWNEYWHYCTKWEDMLESHCTTACPAQLHEHVFIFQNPDARVRIKNHEVIINATMDHMS